MFYARYSKNCFLDYMTTAFMRYLSRYRGVLITYAEVCMALFKEAGSSSNRSSLTGHCPCDFHVSPSSCSNSPSVESVYTVQG